MPIDFAGREMGEGWFGPFGQCGNVGRIMERGANFDGRTFESNENRGRFSYVIVNAPGGARELFEEALDYAQSECPERLQTVSGPDLGGYQTIWYDGSDPELDLTIVTAIVFVSDTQFVRFVRSMVGAELETAQSSLEEFSQLSLG